MTSFTPPVTVFNDWVSKSTAVQIGASGHVFLGGNLSVSGAVAVSGVLTTQNLALTGLTATALNTVQSSAFWAACITTTEGSFPGTRMLAVSVAGTTLYIPAFTVVGVTF